MAAAGYLAACGVSRQDAVRVVSWIVAWKGDEEADDRLTAVRTTYDRVAAGEPVKGRAALAELLDPKVMVAISKWLGRGASDWEGKRHSDPSAANGGGSVFESMGTDLGAATAFAAAVEGKLIYADDTQRWLRNKMGVLEPVTGENVVGVAVDFVRHLNQNATRGFERDHIKKLESSGRIRSMLDLAKPQLRRSQSSFDRDSMLAGCRNGVMDLRARCLVETDDVVTKSLRAVFDPGAECANFEKFISEVFDADEEVIRFVQRAVGYTLTGTTSAQCLFVCIGSGSNGKSTFSGILHALMGDYAATVPMHTLMQSRYGAEKTDDLSTLKTVRYASAQEGEAGSQLAEAKIKIMTGGDPITCRQLYKNYERYTPQFKLWLSTSDLPQIRGTGEAIWRRIHVIPFPVTFSNDRKDPGLKDKLMKELPGILNWALEGLRMFQVEGLNPPSAIQKATGDYCGESDTVRQFVNDCCNRFFGTRTPMSALYDAYKEWCSSSGLEPLSNVSLGKKLTRLGFESYRSKEGNGRKDLLLKD